jgi:hypothetical protein
MHLTRHISLYKQMKRLLSDALFMLDEESKSELARFVRLRQHPSGAFNNRAGEADLYYSLFGFWLVETLKEKRQLEALKHYVAAEKIGENDGFIQTCCRVLLRRELKVSPLSRVRAFFTLVKAYRKEREAINLSYRGFVLALTIDRFFPLLGILRYIGKRLLKRTVIDENSPCSERAARLVLQTLAGEHTEEGSQAVLALFDGENGFKAFHQTPTGDMLSTAVALFALRYSRTDLRLIAPECLQFIQNQFYGGAFLSGDGDPTADVEYTFYGLLALGALAD